MVRVNTIQKIVIPECNSPCVCKVMVKRTFEDTTICMVKLHYNGQLYLCPEDQLERATPEDRKNDKKNENYWRNEYEISQRSISRIYLVNSPVTPYP